MLNMFICNISLNKTKTVKYFFTVIAIILIIFFGISAYRIFRESINASNARVNDTIPNPDVIDIRASNYTNILKSVHDNLSNYIGKKIHFSGYIYKVSDFTKTQFVLARDMVISSDLRTLVVGFLCESNELHKFETNTWVEITGTIEKGYYIEEIPIIRITEMKKINKPEECLVYPPDESFVPTSNLF